jgi:hypothetical protein
MSRSDKFALATLLPLLGISALMQVFLLSNGDKGWLLLAAKMMLEGKRLYVDVVEINPPLILWIYEAPAWLSEHIKGIADYQWLAMMGLMGVFISTTLCAQVLRFQPVFAQNKRKRVECVLLLLCLFIFLTPQNYFFDREHIMLVFTFPYVLRFMPSLARQNIPRPLKICIGLLAVIGFCIKPHTIILFVSVQLLYLFRQRSITILWSIENVIIYISAAVYFGGIWYFTPEYITIILPMALATYTEFGRSGSSLLCLPPALFCAGLTFADFRLRYTSPYRQDIYYFIGISVAFLMHSIASNGWDYTYHPLMCSLLFLSGLVFYEYQWLKEKNAAEGLPVKQFVFGMRGCAMSLATQGIYMTLMTFTYTGVFFIQQACALHPACLLKDPYVRYVHDHNVHSFGTITQDFPKWVELVRVSGASWETRFNHLWMLPKLLEEGEAATPRQAWIIPYVAGALADDLDTRKPQIVFVDIGRQFSVYPRYVDLLEFLSNTQKFKAAWSHYRYADTIDECDKPGAPAFKGGCKYAIFSRKP